MSASRPPKTPDDSPWLDEALDIWREDAGRSVRAPTDVADAVLARVETGVDARRARSAQTWALAALLLLAIGTAGTYAVLTGRLGAAAKAPSSGDSSLQAERGPRGNLDPVEGALDLWAADPDGMLAILKGPR